MTANNELGTAGTVADMILQRFADDGVDTVFGLTGGGIMHLVDALARSTAVRLVAMHHEEYVGVAADGYARAGKPYGVALATTGPGAAQTFAAVAAAWQDSSPVIFLLGQVKTADSSTIQGLELRQNGTFEFDTTRSFAPITKSVTVVRDAAHAVSTIDEAIHLATTGRPGPVVIEIPLDVQGATCPAGVRSPRAHIVPAEQPTVEHLAELLRTAERPLVLLGMGTVRAKVDQTLADALDHAGIPYIVTQFARQAGSLEHSLFLGSPGIKANRSANLALAECDLLLAVGSSLHQQVVGWDARAFSDLPSRKVWFELDPAIVAARRSLVDESYVISSEAITPRLIEALGAVDEQRVADWRSHCARLRADQLLHYPAHADVPGRMDFYRAVSSLSERAASFSAAVTDAGIAWYVMAQHFFPTPGSTYLSSGSFGAMGMALPMSIGAACATGSPVLAVTGDGSIMMSLAELASLRAANLPVLLVINNNDGYLSIRSTQDRFFAGRHLGTDGSNGVLIPPIERLADVFEIPFHTASDSVSLDRALDACMAALVDGPVILEINTFVDQAVEPFIASRQLPDGSFASASLAFMEPPIGSTRD